MQVLIIILQKRLVSNQPEFQEEHGFGTASQFPLCLNTACLSKEQFRPFNSSFNNTFTLAVGWAGPIDS